MELWTSECIVPVRCMPEVIHTLPAFCVWSATEPRTRALSAPPGYPPSRYFCCLGLLVCDGGTARA